MKKMILICAIPVLFFAGAAEAQGTNGNKASTVTKNKPVSNNPGQAIANEKAPVAQKEPRRSRTSSPEFELKQAKK